MPPNASTDFHANDWKRICTALIEHDFLILTVKKYLSLREEKKLPEKYVILRHDIDRRPNHAKLMAELEKELDISSTYYFRIPYTFNKEIIQSISKMGHEIGFHYECLSKTKGNIQKAHEIFASELQQIRDVANVDTICMHGRPLSPHDNREIWNDTHLSSYNLKGEAYLSIDNVYYFTDTARSWGSTNSVRDALSGSLSHPVLTKTDELVEWLSLLETGGVYITSHPERWAFSAVDGVYCQIMDSLLNTGKKIVRIIRK